MRDTPNATAHSSTYQSARRTVLWRRKLNVFEPPTPGDNGSRPRGSAPRVRQSRPCLRGARAASSLRGAGVEHDRLHGHVPGLPVTRPTHLELRVGPPTDVLGISIGTSPVRGRKPPVEPFRLLLELARILPAMMRHSNEIAVTLCIPLGAKEWVVPGNALPSSESTRPDNQREPSSRSSWSNSMPASRQVISTNRRARWRRDRPLGPCRPTRIHRATPGLPRTARAMGRLLQLGARTERVDFCECKRRDRVLVEEFVVLAG